MFYLINSGGTYADIGFGDPELCDEPVIAVINEEYDHTVRYRITDDGYEVITDFMTESFVDIPEEPSFKAELMQMINSV